MKKRVLVLLIMITLVFGSPLFAQEELMTKLFFDNYVRQVTSPLEQQIRQLEERFSQLNRSLNAIKSQLVTEIKIVIGQFDAWIDGKRTVMDAAPIIDNGRTMVPVRFIGEAFGAEFAWDQQTQKVTFTLDGLQMEIYIGKKTARVNGREAAMDAAPFIAGGRTMVPLRFVGEYMNAAFDWDSATQTVTITR